MQKKLPVRIIIFVTLFIFSHAAVLADCSPDETTTTDTPDVITCSGSAMQAVGKGGDDTITNESDGNVLNGLFGGDGNDAIDNQGKAKQAIGGDGDDTIVNAGVIVSIKGGEGNDTVILQDSMDSEVFVFGDNGSISSGGENIIDTNDILRFQYTMSSKAEHESASAAIAALNAAGGTITINGQSVTYYDFEQLEDALIKGYTITVTVDIQADTLKPSVATDGRISPESIAYATAVAYCNNGGLQVYAADGNLQLAISSEDIASMLAMAQETGSNQIITTAGEFGVYALHTWEVQVMGPDGYTDIFSGDTCH